MYSTWVQIPIPFTHGKVLGFTLTSWGLCARHERSVLDDAADRFQRVNEALRKFRACSWPSSTSPPSSSNSE